MAVKRYYTVEISNGHGDSVEIVTARSLKNARAEAYSRLKSHPGHKNGTNSVSASIYLGNDYENGVDGDGEKDAYITYSRQYAQFVYVVEFNMKSIVCGYALHPDGSLGSRLFVEGT